MPHGAGPARVRPAQGVVRGCKRKDELPTSCLLKYIRRLPSAQQDVTLNVSVRRRTVLRSAAVTTYDTSWRDQHLQLDGCRTPLGGSQSPRAGAGLLPAGPRGVRPREHAVQSSIHWLCTLRNLYRILMAKKGKGNGKGKGKGSKAKLNDSWHRINFLHQAALHLASVSPNPSTINLARIYATDMRSVSRKCVLRLYSADAKHGCHDVLLMLVLPEVLLRSVGCANDATGYCWQALAAKCERRPPVCPSARSPYCRTHLALRKELGDRRVSPSNVSPATQPNWLRVGVSERQSLRSGRKLPIKLCLD